MTAEEQGLLASFIDETHWCLLTSNRLIWRNAPTSGSLRWSEIQEFDEGLQEVLDLERRAVLAFGWMEETGFYVEAAPLEEYLTAYIDGAGLRDEPKGPLFRTIGRGTGRLTRTPLPLVRARALAAAYQSYLDVATRSTPRPQKGRP